MTTATTTTTAFVLNDLRFGAFVAQQPGNLRALCGDGNAVLCHRHRSRRRRRRPHGGRQRRRHTSFCIMQFPHSPPPVIVSVAVSVSVFGPIAALSSSSRRVALRKPTETDLKVYAQRNKHMMGTPQSGRQTQPTKNCESHRHGTT